MADTRLTKISPMRALQYCAFAVLSPRRLLQAQGEDEKTRLKFPQPPSPQDSAVYRVRRAFWVSVCVVMGAIIVGFLAGKSAGALMGAASHSVVVGLQVAGATLLLWATLFVRGWDIQTVGGVTLTERVNQWLYRGMYFIGTSIIVMSVVLP